MHDCFGLLVITVILLAECWFLMSNSQLIVE